MRLRYRILTSKRNQKEFGAVAADIVDNTLHVGRRSEYRPWAWLLGLLRAGVETPRVVLESDGEAELWEVQKLLREGRMGPRDLVDSGTGWREAREFEPLAALCLEAERAARARRALWAGGALAVLGLVGWLAWALW